MQYNLLENIKQIFMKYRLIFTIVLCIFVFLILFSLFKTGYASRSYTSEFEEIQGYLETIRKKDKDIYNKLKVKEVQETVKGIDVSSFQGDIDWDKVKESGIEFVMIRCGYRNLSNDELHEDSKFRYNIEEANRVGIKAGVYFYSTAINQKEALEEATYVLNLIKDYDVTFPVAYDFELFNQKRTIGVDDSILNENAKYFLDYIEDHGYVGMMYSNLSAINYHWNINDFKYKLWYAQYIDVVTYEDNYDMWQYADNGRIEGILGNVDLNESYFNYEVVG